MSNDDHTPASGDDWLDLGELTAPWGVRGEVKVRLDADLDYARQIKKVYLGDERRPVDLLGVFRRGRFTTFRLRGVATLTAAEELRGAPVSIPRAEAPPLPEGQFYVRDVLGLRVETTDGRALGAVADVISTGANDVYVVRGERGEVLIPAIRDVVVLIDPAAGLMRVEPVPGLLGAP